MPDAGYGMQDEGALNREFLRTIVAIFAEQKKSIEPNQQFYILEKFFLASYIIENFDVNQIVIRYLASSNIQNLNLNKFVSCILNLNQGRKFNKLLPDYRLRNIS